ncbi:MAG: acyltransferase [Alphaproteobacteria bacterium]|nr:acyltransferase [Alphaproteobacteria bacterium]
MERTGENTEACTHKRYAYIDVFRCIAVLLVVAAHTFVIGYIPPTITTIFDQSRFSFGFFNIGAPLFRGHLGVWIFFCLSGVTMAMIAHSDVAKNGTDLHDRGSFKNFASLFWKKRLLRIYPLFLLHLILCNFLVRAGIKVNLLSMLMLSNLFSSHITALSSVMWSLVVEIQFYALFPFIFRFIDGRRRRLALLLLVTAPSLLLLKAIFWNPVPHTFLFIMANNVPGFIFFFLFGIGAYEFREKISDIWRSKYIKIGGISLLAVCLFWNTSRVLISTENLVFLVATSLIAILVMGGMRLFIDNAFRAGNPLVGVAAFLGRASYSIYLFHGFAVFELEHMLESFHHILIGAMIKMICGVAFGCAVYLLVEKPLLQIKDGIIRSYLAPAANKNAILSEETP